MRQRTTPVRIYDAFMFNSELDMLEVGCAALCSHVLRCMGMVCNSGHVTACLCAM